jgi:hypothetical protein
MKTLPHLLASAFFAFALFVTFAVFSGCSHLPPDWRARLPSLPTRPAPEPPDAGHPAPDLPPAPPATSDFPPGTRFLHADVSAWPVTATLTASVDARTIHLRYDKANTWPVLRQRAQNGGPLVGNVWALIRYEGQYYAVAWDWMRQGQESKARSAFRGTGGHMPAPLHTFTPRSGETYHFFVTTAARGTERSGNQRSNLSPVTWP